MAGSCLNVVWICNPDNLNIRIFNPLKVIFTCCSNIFTIFALGIASEVEPIYPAVPFSNINFAYEMDSSFCYAACNGNKPEN